MTRPPCLHLNAEDITCGPRTRPYVMRWCPNCASVLEPTDHRIDYGDRPRSSQDRIEAETPDRTPQP